MTMVAILGFLALIALLAAGVPIYVALIGVATALILLVGGSVAGIGQHLLDHLNSPTLMAVPFFVMAAALMQGGGVAKALIDLSAAWVGRLPGGIPIAAVLATALFAAINGSSVATALAMGTLVVPALLERGYALRFALGLMATAGTLGILIPPSLPLIIYALISETSVLRLFLAGVVPGLLQAAMLCLYVLVIARRLGGRSEPFPGWRSFGATNVAALPALSIPVIVLGGIYGGVVTITEAAALSAAAALVVALFFYRTMKARQVPSAILDAMERTTAIVVIVAGAALLSYWIARSTIASQLVAIVTHLNLEAWEFLLIMNLILLILGMFLEGIAIQLITVPLTLPILAALGIDKIHYAIMLTITIEIAMLTPPVGLNLFVMANITKAPITEVIRGVAPFLLLMILLLALVTFVPALSTYLPDLVLGKAS